MKVFAVNVDRLKRVSLGACFMVFICAGLVKTYFDETKTIATMMPIDQKVIVLDAGHGGWDPGKTGVNGEDEKNINLKIVKKLQQHLEQAGAIVIVTRIEDEALSNKKREDMRGRKDIINDCKGDILISIHQNAFPSTNVKGAQVFYHKNSEQGKLLAEAIQNKFKMELDSDNNRVVKANEDYYILKTTQLPAAIVECGFISNPSEEALLNDDSYQEKVAWAIYLGILDYFQNEMQQNNV